MSLELDKYADLDSPLHRWEPRCKLVGLAALIFAFSFVQDLRLLPAMLLVTGSLYAIARLPFSFLISRLRLPGFFLLAIALLLPFTSGQTILWSWGSLALRQEGILSLILIATRFVSILTIGLILFGTGSFLMSIRAMRSLGLPPLLADMTLLSYRYLYEIGDQFYTMKTAMRLRGFQAHRLSRRNFTMLAALAGSLLVRSYEQSERIYQAMILRGYGHTSTVRHLHRANAQDMLILASVLVLAGSFVIAEILL